MLHNKMLPLLWSTLFFASNLASVNSDTSEKEAAIILTEIGGILSEKPALKIISFHVNSTIYSRFATTIVFSRMKNWLSNPAEASFSVVLPDQSFISNFTMFVKNETIVGTVKEKAKAKADYERAKSRGQSAGHIEQNPRRMNVFKISVNVGSREKIAFKLTYQEILSRTNGYYKHVVHVKPKEIVQDLRLTLLIEENAQISDYHLPEPGKNIGDLTTNELLKKPSWSDDNWAIRRNLTMEFSKLTLFYSPTTKEQREFGKNGIDAQFVLLYDVERPRGGQLKAVNGYFVHFFAPKITESLPKHVVFVIDKSGSMDGEKIQQTKEAMSVILQDLSTLDYFNIITFSDAIYHWKKEPQSVNMDSIFSARKFVNETRADGGTNINSALLVALDMLIRNISSKIAPSQPVVIFLTDGQATAGEQVPQRIVRNIMERQKTDRKVSIHCISFGSGADFGLLKKIASRNNGVAKKIYEHSDAAIQLHDFYLQISNPLLTNVDIEYLDETVEPNSIITGDDRIYYKGSEIVTVGKLKDRPENDMKPMKLKTKISGSGYRMNYDWNTECIISRWPRPFPIPVELPTPSRNGLLPSSSLGGFVERMWAYKSIKKWLKQADTMEDDGDYKRELRAKALLFSLKYNFVTELTSMVVVQDKREIQPYLKKEQEENDRETALQMKPQFYSHSGRARTKANYRRPTLSPVKFHRDLTTTAADEVINTKPMPMCHSDQLAIVCDQYSTCRHETCDTFAVTQMTRAHRNCSASPMTSQSCRDYGKMCICKPEFVEHEGRCIEPRRCPQWNCTEKAVLKWGCFLDCEAKCGDNRHFDLAACPILCDAVKCMCERGFFRSNEGKCLTADQCDDQLFEFLLA